MLRNIGKLPDVIVFGIFDCCREKLRPELADVYRGGGGEDVEVNEHESNFIFTFGCPPNGSVDARSTIAVEYFQTLHTFAEKQHGTVYLPSP